MTREKNLLASLLVAALPAALPAQELEAVDAARSSSSPSAQPHIEVVFVLDTTGSMGGLIQSAKEKIWSIANALASTKPAPEIRMGLVAYRDRGDAYVTRRKDLSEDLDAIYAELMGYRAEGGGDGPESVNQGLHEAVTAMGWNGDDGAFRVIYLVGDFPPHMDYEDDVKYQDSCKLAAERGIVVNTVQCGGHAPTTPIWEEIAKRAEGRMFRVAQDGGAAVVATPFDAPLAELAQRLDGTRVWYGTEPERLRQSVRDEDAKKIYAGASIEAQAARCAFNVGAAGGSNWLAGGKELLTDLAEGRVKLADIDTSELPEDLQKLDATGRAVWIEARQTERTSVQAEIAELTKQRDLHLRENLSTDLQAANAAWDSAILDAAREQAARCGITIEGGR